MIGLWTVGPFDYYNVKYQITPLRVVPQALRLSCSYNNKTYGHSILNKIIGKLDAHRMDTNVSHDKGVDTNLVHLWA